MGRPTVTRPMEYIAFFTVEMKIAAGSAHLYFGVDANSGYAFNLGIEQTKNPETVLSAVEMLLNDAEFKRYKRGPFTLVLEEFHELEAAIATLIAPFEGKLLFNKSFNNELANPVLISIRQTLFNKPS